MGPPLALTTAVGSHPHTMPLKAAAIGSEGVRLEHVEIAPINRAFRMRVNDLAFDVSELAIVTYLLARSADRPLAGIPAVLLRLSPFESIVVSARSGIREPKDLEGRAMRRSA